MKKLLFVLLGISLLASCGGGSKEANVEFRLISDGVPHTVGETFYKGDTAIAFDLFHLYLSNLSFDGTMATEVAFINNADSATTHWKVDLNKPISTISFGLGLDAEQNASDPTTFETTHPLSSAQAMYWSWASKYRFVKADGRANFSGTLGAGDEYLIWHTGLDTLYREVTFDQHLEPGQTLIINLNLTKHLNNISLENNLLTHTDVLTFDIAERVTESLVQSFELEVIE